MQTLDSVLLALTLLLCGGYAGMAVMCQIGVLPAMRRLSPTAYRDAFVAMDIYMDRAMPPYKLGLLAVNAALLVRLLLAHRVPLAVVAGISFACSLIALILTLRKQLPLNTELKNLPAGADDTTLVRLRDATTHNFGVRLGFAIVAFVALCIGATWWPLR